jgi:hypothetical protein
MIKWVVASLSEYLSLSHLADVIGDSKREAIDRLLKAQTGKGRSTKELGLARDAASSIVARPAAGKSRGLAIRFHSTLQDGLPLVRLGFPGPRFVSRSLEAPTRARHTPLKQCPAVCRLLNIGVSVRQS